MPLSALNASKAPIVYTTPTSAPSLLPGVSLEQAWDVLSKEASWKSVEAKHEWHERLGAHDVSALEFLMDEEIDELEQWLTTIPFRRFKKFMGK